MAFERRFDATLPFGTCLGVALPGAPPPESEWPATLNDHEREFARGLAEGRRSSWIGGRTALREALQAQGLSAPEAILSTARGAPRLPPGAAGSISHKACLAVALAAPAGTPAATIGIDLEELRPLRVDVAGRVLTAAERAGLPASGPDRDAHLLRLFAAKEAIYKALDPWLGRFIGFQEAEVGVRADGRLTSRLALSGGEGPFALELHDLSALAGPGYLLLAAVARRA